MRKPLFIGVDGGATKCIVRVEDEAGNLLGRDIEGPANIRLSIITAWQSINSALTTILRPLNIVPGDPHYRWHAGMGLAGCEMREAYQAFLAHPHFFDTLMVTSDAHAACLGAHGGRDGAIIIVGTGVVGFQIASSQTRKIGGWGFPHDDEGGGAWLGLEAIKLTLQCLDGRRGASKLGDTIYAHFDGDLNKLIAWTNQANSTAFAELAPMVIQLYQQGDSDAISLMQQAAQAINKIGEALLPDSSPLLCALVGGITPFIEPLLGDKLRGRLSICQQPPDAGALLLVRECLVKHSSYEVMYV